MAETIMKPKGLGISSPHCGSYLALIGERQDTSSVRRMILHGAGSFLALRVEVARSLDANSSLSNCWSSWGEQSSHQCSRCTHWPIWNSSWTLRPWNS